ncbi:Tuberous sclerosis 2-like protein [Varicellaria rhodocarpa]|nr:Tuberous sclerosis 2-like protein [Varicellaria rhodocarpa]
MRPLKVSQQPSGCQPLYSLVDSSMTASGQAEDTGNAPATLLSPALVERVRAFAGGRNVPTLQGDVGRGERTSSAKKFSYGKNSETDFQDKAIRDLDVARRTAERSEAIDALAQQINFYPVETLMKIWVAAEDLVQETAAIEARNAGFILLNASALHTGLASEERMRFFEMIIIPVGATSLNSQVKALNSLSDSGQNLDPFKPRLASFLNKTIKSQFESVMRKRAEIKNLSNRPSKMFLPEEAGLEALLNLTSDMIVSNPDVYSSDDAFILVGRILWVAQKTTSETTVKGAVSILAVLIGLSKFPIQHLKTSIEVLCAVTCTVGELTDLAWHCLLTILQVPTYQTKSLGILLEILSKSPQDRKSSTVRGALEMVKHLFFVQGREGLPAVSSTQLIIGLWEIHFKLQRECLQIINVLLRDEQFAVKVSDGAWGIVIKILFTATGNHHYIKDATHPANLRTTLFSRSPQVTLPDRIDKDQTVEEDILVDLKDVVKSLVSLWPSLNSKKRTDVGSFFNQFYLHITPEAAELLFQQIATEGIEIPHSVDWNAWVKNMLSHFFLDKNQSPHIRCSVLQLLKNAVANKTGDTDRRNLRQLLLHVLVSLEIEHCVQVANEVAALAITWLLSAAIDDVEPTVRALRLIVGLEDECPANLSTLHVSKEPIVNTVTTSLVRLFLQCLNSSARKATIVYDALVDLAANKDEAPNARLTAMKLLTRLRCDSSHAILVIPTPDSLNLAATLCRTEDSAFPTNMNRLHGEQSSLNDEQSITRMGRTSKTSTSRPNTRSASGQERVSKPTPPLWMYPGGKGLPDDPHTEPSDVLFVATPESDQKLTLRIRDWLEAMIGILQQRGDWEIYSYVLVHLPSQLSNSSLFSNAAPHIRLLRSIISDQLVGRKFHSPPTSTGVKDGDVALCLFQSLIMLLGYSDHFARGEQDAIVRTLLFGIGAWDRVMKTCIHALTVCCHEIPLSITRSLNGILQKMVQIITQSNLAMDILEFLGGLARLPDVHANLTEDELRTVFAICTKHLEISREQRYKLSGPELGASYTSTRQSGLSADFGSISDSSQSTDAYKDLPQYVFALAYHVITFWFLSLKLADRSKHVGWITSRLASKDHVNGEIMEEQSQVTLDMMHRTAYLDLGETIPVTNFQPSDGKIARKSWLLGLCILTIETAVGTGLTQITKRQASGTTYAMYQQHTAPLPPHHEPAPSDIMSSTHGPESRINALPNHIFLQLTSTIAPMPTPMEPICLPDDDATKRAIASFDRNDTVDGYRVGVIYVGNNQSSEAEILANSSGSKTFDALLAGIGTKVQLKSASFNTQGLDRVADSDGTHTYAWRDRVTEIVYHVPTMMPTDLESDAQCVSKKRLIGNDFVNVVFNESGLPYKFDTISSQFNYVNIVITPDALLVPNTASYPKGDQVTTDGTRFQVQTVSNPSFPQISPAASYKLISAKALPGLVRQLALNASVFSHVWVDREGGEHVSSWRNRLREIVRLRQRFANTGTSVSARFPGVKGDKTYVDGDKFTGIVAMSGLAEEEGILGGLDFSRWAGPNPPLA